MRVGVLGGSFDPIHNAHLIVAQLARDTLALDVVRFMVAAESPFKIGRHLATAEARLAMVRLAVQDVPGLIADGRELARPGPSYTVDTLRELAADDPGGELILLVGSDAARGLSEWREPDAVMALATVAVCARAGAAVVAPAGAVRFDVPAMEISSTAVRERASRGGSLAGWVPPAVADYIVASQLYRSLNG